MVFNLQVSYFLHVVLKFELDVLEAFEMNNIVLLQVPGSTHYSMVFYFVSKELVPGSLLQRFVDGDDEFRNSRMKLIPSVPKVLVLVSQLKFQYHVFSVHHVSLIYSMLVAF